MPFTIDKPIVDQQSQLTIGEGDPSPTKLVDQHYPDTFKQDPPIGIHLDNPMRCNPGLETEAMQAPLGEIARRIHGIGVDLCRPAWISL